MRETYLICDSCNKILSQKKIRPKVYSLYSSLREYAKELGWIYTSQGDYCPDPECHKIEAQRYNNV